ncbi:unnamed protein product, partial [Ectocarpus fasciculatus]
PFSTVSPPRSIISSYLLPRMRSFLLWTCSFSKELIAHSFLQCIMHLTNSSWLVTNTAGRRPSSVRASWWTVTGFTRPVCLAGSGRRVGYNTPTVSRKKRKYRYFVLCSENVSILDTDTAVLGSFSLLSE